MSANKSIIASGSPNDKIGLGREVKISPKSIATVLKSFTAEYNDEHIVITVNIGKEHSADLIMSREALEALQNRENEITTETVQQFKKKLK